VNSLLTCVYALLLQPTLKGMCTMPNSTFADSYLHNMGTQPIDLKPCTDIQVAACTDIQVYDRRALQCSSLAPVAPPLP
jgi:hypothetical protein